MCQPGDPVGHTPTAACCLADASPLIPGDPRVGDPSIGDPSIGVPSLGDPSLGDPSLCDTGQLIPGWRGSALIYLLCCIWG